MWRTYSARTRPAAPVHQMVLQPVEDGLLQPVDPDGQPVAAGALVSRRRASEPVGAHLDHPYSAQPAFDQPGEQGFWPSPSPKCIRCLDGLPAINCVG